MAGEIRTKMIIRIMERFQGNKQSMRKFSYMDENKMIQMLEPKVVHAVKSAPGCMSQQIEDGRTRETRKDWAHLNVCLSFIIGCRK